MKWGLIIICWFVPLLFSVSLVYKDTRQVLLIKKKKMEITLTRIYLTEESAFYQKDHGKILFSEGFALYWERDTLRVLHETIRNDDFERNTA